MVLTTSFFIEINMMEYLFLDYSKTTINKYNCSVYLFNINKTLCI